MILQVGQTTQPRIPERNDFPTTVICRTKPYDESKLNKSGLPKSLFFPVNNNDFQGLVFPDLDKTWNNVTMGLGHTLNVTAAARYWDGSKGKEVLIELI